jgi:hypothetical protein
MITPPTVVQVEGFSDVEGRNTNYKHLMTDMNKEWLFKPTNSSQRNKGGELFYSKHVVSEEGVVDKQKPDIQFAKKTQDNTQRNSFTMFLPNSK